MEHQERFNAWVKPFSSGTFRNLHSSKYSSKGRGARRRRREKKHTYKASKSQIREDKKDQKEPCFPEELDVHRGFIFQQHLRNSVFVHSTALAVSFGSREKEG